MAYAAFSICCAVLEGGPPPEKRVGLSSVTAPRVALKSLTHESPDEPYGWPAREFMRDRLIGQQVHFKVEYTFNGKEYACVTFKGENVACELLRRGLAKLRDNKNPPNAHDLEGKVLPYLLFICGISRYRDGDQARILILCRPPVVCRSRALRGGGQSKAAGSLLL